jgi:hypothetical protein
VALLEAAAFRFGPPDIVFLDGHRVRNPILQHALKRSPQVGNPRCRRVVRVVGKDLEELSPENVFAGSHRGPRVGVGDGYDDQFWRQDEIKAR